MTSLTRQLFRSKSWIFSSNKKYLTEDIYTDHEFHILSINLDSTEKDEIPYILKEFLMYRGKCGSWLTANEIDLNYSNINQNHVIVFLLDISAHLKSKPWGLELLSLVGNLAIRETKKDRLIKIFVL